MKLRNMLTILAVMMLSVFAVSAATNLTAGFQDDSLAANPGQTVTFSVDVANLDTVDDFTASFSSTALVDAGHSVSAPSIGNMNVAKSTTSTKSFDVVVPAVAAGTYAGTLTVTAGSDSVDLPYTLTVNAAASYSLDKSSVTLVGQGSTNTEVDITVTNTGSVSLTTFSAVYAGDLEDNDGDKLAFTYDYPAALAPGAQGTFTVHVDIEKGMDVDSYAGTVSLTANTIVKMVSVETKVMPQICDEGMIGDLSVTIKNPDSGDDFAPGDEVSIDVEVENTYSKDMDVGVEAILYNLDEDDNVVTIKSEIIEINDGDDETFNLDMIIPSADLDDEDSYVLYVKAFEDGSEDDNCDYDSVELNIERDDNMVVVNEMTFTPDVVRAGEKVHVIVEFENAGTDDQKNVYAEIKEPELGLNAKSEKVGLDAYDESDSDYVWQFDFTVPKNAVNGDYYLQAKVYFNDDEESTSQLVKLTVSDGAASKDEAGSIVAGGVVVTAEQGTVSLKDGQSKFTLPLVVENNGDSSVKVKLDVSEFSAWAELISVESPEKLNPGDRYHVYVYLMLKDGVQPGVHNLRVNLRNDEGLISSKLMAVEIPSEAKDSTTSLPVGAAVVEPASKVKQLLDDKGKLFWIGADLVLIILAVFFIRLLFRK
ncbi:MAG: putative S-layer protein [Candidatus Woesearchaeota archaeon]